MESQLILEKTDEENESYCSERTKKIIKGAIVFLFFASIIIFFNFYPPARDFILDAGLYVQSLGWTGILLFIFINGCIAIPFALPYSLFEIIMCMTIKSYFQAFGISFASKFAGCSVSYVIGKYLLNRKIRELLQHEPLFHKVESVLEREPFKFSVIFRVITLPFFVKNYALAIPKKINYLLYITAALTASIPHTATHVYLYQQIQDIHHIFEKSDEEIIFTICMVILSISLLTYIFFYTKKVMKMISEEDKLKGSTLELSSHVPFEDETKSY